MTRYSLYSLLVASLCAGCSILPAADPVTRHDLAPAQSLVSTPYSSARTVIRVAKPDVAAAFKQDRLMLVDNGQITQYAGQAWQAPVPQMLADDLLRDLAAALPQSVLVGPRADVAAKFEVQSTVHAFATVKEASGRTSVVIDIDVLVVDVDNRQIVKHLPYRYNQPLPALTTANTLNAYNAGWQAFVSRLAELLKF